MKKLFVITGPTAVGKSETGIRLAKMFGGEIVSADSMQIYKGLDIGTGKLTPEEMCGVTHHMIDVAMPDENYSVGQYVRQARDYIDGINSIPLIVGGTGLYITALVAGSDFGGAGKSEDIRDKWKEIARQKGNEFVYDYLKKIDAPSADKINVNDIKRIIRAIEIYELTGKPKSSIVGESNAYYSARVIILTRDRQDLYNAIETRVDKMFERGLVKEVEGLIEYKSCQSMQAIGYKETVRFLTGEITLDEAVEKIKQNSRNYAKRQMTYFKGMKLADKHFVNFNDFDEIKRLFDEFQVL